MKKTIRRSMGIVMALALLLTGLLCVGTAQADNKVTFESTDTGKITVHKYLYDGNEGAAGTGDELGTAPGNESLKNTNFKLVPIANATDAINYFKGESGVTYTENSTKIESASIIEATTDNNGKFEFATVPVGIYILEEYEAPDYIDRPLTKCVVSMPMTNGDGDAWNFNVHVYPKNNVKAAEVHLTKQDQKKQTKLLGDVMFELKVKKGDDWVAVTDGEGNNAFTDLATGTSDEKLGKLDIVGLPKNTPATYRLYETANTNTGTNGEAYIVNKNYIEFTVDAYNKITVDTNTNGEISAECAANNLTITMTNDYPTFNKQVNDVNNNKWSEGTETDAVSFGTNEEVEYRLIVYVPVNVTDLRTFRIFDNVGDGQEVVSSIAFNNGEEDVTSFFERVGNTESKNEFTWELDSTKSKEAVKNKLAGKTITISYKATFTEKVDLYGDGNKNTAYLEYSPVIGEDDPTPLPKITDETIVYTYDYQINKVLQKLNSTDATDPGEGVTFKVTTADEAKTQLKFTQVTNASGEAVPGVYRLTETGDTEVVTNSDGKIVLQGLDAGQYILTETKTVPGYNLLTGTVTLTVTASTENTDHIETNEKTIINKQGFELPQTGSLGFLLFCAAGLVLVLAGAGLMMSGRKRTIR